jgi:RNA polymerase sigma factor (sigma-70 family)
MDMSRPSAILLRTQSDERLVTLARAGHERAFEAIVRRHRRGLLGACARICADGRAEDVLQQALLSAWAGLRRGDDVRDLRAWLYRIVRNEAVSHRRRAGRDGLELLDTLSLAPSPQEEAERRAVVQETLEAIAGLPERQRAALLSIAVQGRSQDEVAGELGLSAVAVARSCTGPEPRCAPPQLRSCRCRWSPGRPGWAPRARPARAWPGSSRAPAARAWRRRS